MKTLVILFAIFAAACLAVEEFENEIEEDIEEDPSKEIFYLNYCQNGVYR